MKLNKIIGLLLLAALANQAVIFGGDQPEQIAVPDLDNNLPAPDEFPPVLIGEPFDRDDLPNINALKEEYRAKRANRPIPAAAKAAVMGGDKQTRMAALKKAEQSALSKGATAGQVRQLKEHAQMDDVNFNAMNRTIQTNVKIPAAVKDELAALADAAYKAYAEEREQYAQMQRRHRAMKDMDANLAQAKSLLNKPKVSRDEIVQHVDKLSSRIGELATRAQNDPAVQAKLAQASDALAALRAKLDDAVDGAGADGAGADRNKSKVLGKLGKSSKKTAKK